MPAAEDTIANHRIIRLIGTGGFADVYEAEDPLLGRRVALKILSTNLVRSPDVVARFEREVRTVAALSHPGIVPIYIVGQSDGVYFYTMRLLQGGDLRRKINEILTPLKALRVTQDMAAALSYAHSEGVIHRDVKPENVLFDENGRAVLTDFGVAKVIGASSRLTATGMAVGTPHYLSPEQARGLPVDGRADIYSLGVILFEMLTGKPPFDNVDPISVVMMHITEPVPRLPERLRVFQALVDRLMAKNPENRFASAEEARDCVRQYLQDMPSELDEPPQTIAVTAVKEAEPPTDFQGAGTSQLTSERSTSISANPAPTMPRARHRKAAVGLLALTIGLLGVGLWTVFVSTGPASKPATVSDQSAETPTPAVIPESRSERVARERQRCRIHVSQLTGGGDLVYDEATQLPGAQIASDGSGILVPNVQLPGGQLADVLITPRGCVLIRGLPATAE